MSDDRHAHRIDPDRAAGDLDAIGDPRVALWNPNAAANWCVLGTGAFGAWLHMRNWEALGRPDEAAAQKRWMIASLVLTGVAVVAPPGYGLLANLLSFVLLIVWYYGSARRQVRHVRATYGNDYRHRAWRAPLGIAVGIAVALSIASVVVTVLLYGMPDLSRIATRP